MARRARQNGAASPVKGIANEGWTRARHAQAFSSAADAHAPAYLKRVTPKTIVRKELASY